MTVGFVLERVRAGQQTALRPFQETYNVLVNAPPLKKPPSKGPLKRLFTDKHVQSNPRFAPPPGIVKPGPVPQRRQQQQQAEQQQQPQQGVQESRVLQPKHRALAARLAAATERQQRCQQYQQRQQEQQQQQHRGSRHGSWSPQVATDIAVVCQELKLPQALAAALSNAAARGQVSCNPGILLSQLLRLLPLEPQLSALLGLEQQQQQQQQGDSSSSSSSSSALALLLSAQPSLLRVDPASLAAAVEHLQELLGQAAAAAAVKKCPQVLGCSPFRMSANLTLLQHLLGYSSPSAAAAAIARQPTLLLCTTDNLSARWQQLQQLLAAVPADKLQQQMRKAPELLMMRSSTLAAKLKCLELLFAAPAAAAGAAAAAASAADVTAGSAGQSQQQRQQQQQQRLLGVYKQYQMSYRLQRLHQLAQQYSQSQTPWKSQYGYGHNSSTPAATTAAGAVWTGGAAGGGGVSSASVADPRVQQLAIKVPGLLSLTPATLHSHLVELQLLLQLQPDDPRLTRLVLLQPGLLTQAPRTLANKLQLLQHLTGCSEGYVLDMVLRVPAVLTLSAESVGRKWALLSECAGACGLWQQQLAAAPAVSVGMMLCYSLQRLQRLQYVVQLSRQQAARSSIVGVTCADDGSSSSSSGGGAAAAQPSRRRQRQRCMQQHAADPRSSSSGSSEAAVDLTMVPWRSIIQESEAVFCSRFAGYRAWQQQQQQQQLCP